MARHLDPNLHWIIEDASRNMLPSDAPYSFIPDDFTHTTMNRDIGHTGVGESTFMARRYQPINAELDDFDRNILQSDKHLRHFESNNSFSRLSLPTNGTSKNPSSDKTAPPSIYSRQIIQQQPGDEGAHTHALRATTAAGRPYRAQATLNEPTANSHSTGMRDAAHLVRPDPTTPLNLASYAYKSTNRIAATPSSERGPSSPSTRVSLRRISNRTAAPKLPRISPADVNEELIFNTRYRKERITNTAGAFTPPKIVNRPPTVQGIQLLSPHVLPDRFRQIFPYELFNAVQSKCFESIYKTTDNVVVAAPTGSGKTAILELAVCKLVQDYGSEQFKIVYQAPTKSLCSERVRDWEKKFSYLNLPCAELTGDTDNSGMRKVGSATIIVTTPEKWDSITRKWKDHVKLLQLVKLVLIDEVHILKDPRGATLEAVVSRMKSIGANVRFVALSATVPNSDDVAMWLGRNHTNGHLPAHRETFGEEFRPVKLQKHVYGFSANTNDFAFDSLLDTKLPGLIAKHTIRKPMMVFCVTRKICETTAAKLAQWWSSLRPTERPWPIPRRKVAVGRPDLGELVGCGVAFHHAGLNAEDRVAIEEGFLRNELSVICCTSTLAVGVNLPCHLVVIKNTVCYKDTGLSEYSDLEIMQVLGRAGRPQFDDSAIAIIMTRSEKVDRYKLMISGQEILESTLHLNLIEHLNSEIGLGTVYDLYSAKRWLAGTFLSVRMRKNPTYYKFNCDTGTRDADERLEVVCERDIELLKCNQLITEDQHFACTRYGHAMAKYMVQFETMKLLLGIPKNAKMTQILHILCQSTEFKNLRMKANERASFREFNKSPFIKSPIKENISTFAHKVSLIIQIHLGGVDLPMDKEFNIIKRQFQTDKSTIFERMIRLIRCTVECKAYECDAVATCNALELLRSIAAGYWENSTLQLRQLPTIGPAALRKLVQSNVKTVGCLAAMDSAAIERVMSRNPPFGKKILDFVANFPQLTLQADIRKRIINPGDPVKVQVKVRVGYSNAKSPVWNRKAPTATFTASLSNGNLAHIWRGSLRKAEKGFDLTFTCELSRHTDSIICQFACEEIVGTIQSAELKPEISATAFPVLTPTVPPANTAPHRVRVKPMLSAEEEAEIVAALEAEEGVEDAAPGSEYGGGSVFNEFMDIDDPEIDAAGGNDESEPTPSEPIQMENGKWRCNHKCRDAQGNYLNKNGAPCKHLCCREGLEKPRKIAKKKVARFNAGKKVQKSKENGTQPTKVPKKLSKDTLRLQLRLAEREVSFSDIEEIDLVDEPLEAGSAYKTPRAYPAAPSQLSIEGKACSVRISKKAPLSSHASGSQPNLSRIGYHDRDYRSSPDLPSPSMLLANEYPFEYGPMRDSEVLFPMMSYDEPEIPAITNSAPPPKDFADGGFSGFNVFEALEAATQARKASSNKRRLASPSTEEPEPKHYRLLADEEALDVIEDDRPQKLEMVPEVEKKKPLPDWVAEFDQDLISFFGDSVEYKD